MPLFLTELIQPQHIWPYIQQNLIQQHSNQLANRDYHKQQLNCNEVQLFYGPPGTSPEDHNHHHHQQHPASKLTPLEDGRVVPAAPMYGSIESMTSGRDNRVIAKPLPNRPTPFIAAAAAAAAGHGSLNHPHLHSLLTHCRNPYLAGSAPGGGGGEWLENELIFRHLQHSSNQRLSSSLPANVPGQMFPLPGPGFPWAHSNRGKPRRGMMRRAVFSGEQTC